MQVFGGGGGLQISPKNLVIFYIKQNTHNGMVSKYTLNL